MGIVDGSAYCVFVMHTCICVYVIVQVCPPYVCMYVWSSVCDLVRLQLRFL